MLKPTMTMIAVAIALSFPPAMAQQARPDTAQPGTSVVGLPIYSSDGAKLGEVTQVGTHEGQQAVVAQLEPSMGTAARVLIPAEMMTQRGDRLELPMTVEEVKKTISKP